MTRTKDSPKDSRLGGASLTWATGAGGRVRPGRNGAGATHTRCTGLVPEGLSFTAAAASIGRGLAAASYTSWPSGRLPPGAATPTFSAYATPQPFLTRSKLRVPAIPSPGHRPYERLRAAETAFEDRCVAGMALGARELPVGPLLTVCSQAVRVPWTSQHTSVASMQVRRTTVDAFVRRRMGWSGSNPGIPDPHSLLRARIPWSDWSCSLPSYGDPPTAWSPQALSIT
jgi:hypothetical protein